MPGCSGDYWHREAAVAGQGALRNCPLHLIDAGLVCIAANGVSNTCNRAPCAGARGRRRGRWTAADGRRTAWARLLPISVYYERPQLAAGCHRGSGQLRRRPKRESCTGPARSTIGSLAIAGSHCKPRSLNRGAAAGDTPMPMLGPKWQRAPPAASCKPSLHRPTCHRPCARQSR